VHLRVADNGIIDAGAAELGDLSNFCQHAMPVRGADRGRVDAADLVFQRPVPASRGIAGQVGRRRDISVGQAGEGVHEGIARRALGHVATVDQDVAALMQGCADLAELRAFGRQRRRVVG
jgi:hypothetical protein